MPRWTMVLSFRRPNDSEIIENIYIHAETNSMNHQMILDLFKLSSVARLPLANYFR